MGDCVAQWLSIGLPHLTKWHTRELIVFGSVECVEVGHYGARTGKPSCQWVSGSSRSCFSSRAVAFR